MKRGNNRKEKDKKLNLKIKGAISDQEGNNKVFKPVDSASVVPE